MPSRAIAQDLRDGTLVRLDIEDHPYSGLNVQMSIIHLAASPPEIAGRWLIQRLSEQGKIQRL